MHKLIVSSFLSLLTTFAFSFTTIIPHNFQFQNDIVFSDGFKKISCNSFLIPTNKDTISISSIPIELPFSNIDQPELDKRNKFISALFAFPFPFGFVGAHRIIMGTKPWVPIIYVATFGGCFGILPFIDFCVILCSKDLKKFENNPNLFMWIK